MEGDNLVGETLLAVIGAESLLEPGPLRVMAPHRDRARRLEGAIRRECRRFISTPGFLEQDTPDPVDYKKQLARLTAPLDERFAVDKLRGFDDPADAIAFARAAGAAIGYLRLSLPKRYRDTPTGPKATMPSGLEVGRFARVLRVFDDPMSVLTDMNSGLLAREQVRALRDVYPSLYEAMKREIFYAMQAALGQRRSWELPYPKDKILQIFLDTSRMTPALAKDLQQAFAEAEPQQQSTPQPQPLSIDADATQTQVQRISAK